MTVDFIVVGAGSAGCVVANRLARDPSRSVALLEAGPDLRAAAPPELYDAWSFPRDFEWGFESEPYAGGEALRLRRGKLLGGTGWVTRFAVRGSPLDWERWATQGNEGWTFDDVLPYLNRVESDLDFGGEPWHGDRGPIPVNRYLNHELTEVATAATEAAVSMGFPSIDDHNRPGALGVGRMPMNSTNGRRVTSADAYLCEPFPNLDLCPDSQVAEVLFEGVRARGVRLVDGTEIEAGHIVLSGGVYGSPIILMRSGIGPADHLRSVGVDVRVGLNGVGSNLADHPDIEIGMMHRGSSRQAPLLHSMATFHSEGSTSEAPDLMLWWSDPEADEEFFIEAVLLKPHCRGTVRLRSRAASDEPRITLPEPDDADVEKLAIGYARAAEIAMHEKVQRLCRPPEVHTGEAVTAFVRSSTYSLPHVVGTCAMGPSPEDGAVVDSQGRVHGTEGLSVIDASMIPEPPSGFPHLPTIMLAERLGEALTDGV